MFYKCMPEDKFPNLLQKPAVSKLKYQWTGLLTYEEKTMGLTEVKLAPEQSARLSLELGIWSAGPTII